MTTLDTTADTHLATVGDLPEPAQRWLRHSLAPGADPTRSVELELAGRIKLGRWQRFSARQRLDALDGFVWEERTSLLGLPVRGWDSLVDGDAQLRHTLLGRVPLVRQAGPDVTRSAYARLACELVYTPAAALDPRVTWDQLGWNTAVAHVAFPLAEPEDGVDVLLDVERSGQLAAVRCRRWAKRGRRPWGLCWFEVQVLEEASWRGITYPRRVLAGYADHDLRWPKGAFLDQTVLSYRGRAESLPLVVPSPSVRPGGARRRSG